MRSAVKFLTIALYSLCAIAVLMFIVPATGFKALSVATGSMTPAIPTGSLVIVQRTPVSQLKVGDIVTYKPSSHVTQTITHRITERKVEKGIPFFVTKGDANPAADPAIPGGAIIGKVIWHVPGAGFVSSWLRSPVGVLLIVIIPGLLIIYDETRRLRRLLAKKPEPTVSASRPAPPAAPIVSEKKPAAATRRQGVDGMRRPRQLVIALGLLIIAAVSPTYAATFKTNIVTLKGISLNVLSSTGPTTPADCKNDGWKKYKNADGSQRFKNQGQCIAFLVSNSNSQVSSTTVTTVNITNSNSQTATSGSVNVTGNTSGPAGSPTPTPTHTPSPSPAPVHS